MALSTSNTFTLPSQGAAIATSRTQFNSSFRALLQNFYSSSPPTTVNLLSGGTSLTASEYNGMLYRDSATGVLYISDSSITSVSGKTSNPVGGNFTRYGIVWRQEDTIADGYSSISTYDIGDAFAVVQNTGGSSNNRLYMKATASEFVDVGKPAPGQVSETELSTSVKNNILRPTTVSYSTTAGSGIQYNLGSDATAVSNVQVSLSGVVQKPTTDWTLSTASSPYKITLVGTVPAGLSLTITSWAKYTS
jgi:hypothetical protein